MEIKVSDLQKNIKLIETDIQMTLDNINNEKVSDFAKKLLARDLSEKYFLLDKLKNLSNNITDQEFGITWDDIDWSDLERKGEPHEERLKYGISKIGNFVIKEPITKRMFLVRGLEKFGITEPDIIAYNDSTLTKALQIICRNSIECPLVSVRNYMKHKGEGYEELLSEIRIETLDSTGVPLCETIYNGLKLSDVGCVSGDYRSSEPQEFELTITYDDFDINRIDKA